MRTEPRRPLPRTQGALRTRHHDPAGEGRWTDTQGARRGLRAPGQVLSGVRDRTEERRREQGCKHGVPQGGANKIKSKSNKINLPSRSPL